MDINKTTTALANSVASFLSNLNSLLLTLLAYVLTVLFTYLLLKVRIGSGHHEAFIVYQIATGGDPYNFASTFANNVWVWRWLLVLHIFSWLIVPVLAATAVDVVFSIREKKRFALEDQIENAMIQALMTHTTLSSADSTAFARLWRQKMSSLLDRDVS